MVINNDRTPLDDALNDDFATIFLLLGPSPKAAEVHQMMERKDKEGFWDPHQRWFLLASRAVLKPGEKWFDTNEIDPNLPSAYVVLHNGPRDKEVAAAGPPSALLTNDKPDPIKVRREFLKGDL